MGPGLGTGSPRFRQGGNSSRPISLIDGHKKRFSPPWATSRAGGGEHRSPQPRPLGSSSPALRRPQLLPQLHRALTQLSQSRTGEHRWGLAPNTASPKSAQVLCCLPTEECLREPPRQAESKSPGREKASCDGDLGKDPLNREQGHRQLHTRGVSRYAGAAFLSLACLLGSSRPGWVRRRLLATTSAIAMGKLARRQPPELLGTCSSYMDLSHSPCACHQRVGGSDASPGASLPHAHPMASELGTG